MKPRLKKIKGWGKFLKEFKNQLVELFLLLKGSPSHLVRIITHY